MEYLGIQLINSCPVSPFVKVLEKMRPIDQKMKYQIDKMIKSATTGLEGEHPWGLFF